MNRKDEICTTPTNKFAKPSVRRPMVALGRLGLFVGIWMALNLQGAKPVFAEGLRHDGKVESASPDDGTWLFIVSGDSRNCGDVVVPAIAAHSAKHFHPSFYWHLGDLRAIYKVDEDVAFAESTDGHHLACENYLKRAWPDFIEHQIGAFGKTPFYVGIGNHELVPPKGQPIHSTGDKDRASPEVKGEQFTAQFAHWLLAPRLKEQRIKDEDCDNAATKAKDTAAHKQNSKPACLVLPRNYYHWVQGGVDFIYLDNAANVYGRKQLDWFKTRVAKAGENADIHSVVVGMHEALPQSISADHAMCDVSKRNDPKYPWQASCDDGEEVYKTLLDFQKNHPAKPVYVLASHSHFYMEGIFNTRPEAEHLRGWIVGTAGAVRYALPADASKSDAAKTDLYGYLLGTVNKNGEIKFEFQELKEEDVPSQVAKRYPATFVNWCFAHNSQHLDPDAPETTKRCLPSETPKATPSPAK
jgi:hypothetical protein